MEKIIPYGRQYLDEEDIAAVVEVLRSDYLTTGPRVIEFEKRLAEKVGARFAVTFSSGTAALHAAYFAAGLKPGEEVIVSPITFAATANAALYLGGVPVFVDIAPGSFNIDVAAIEAAITPRTRIIAPTDMAGIPVDIDSIMEIAQKYNIIVVEDAAHALGAFYKGTPVGSRAHLTIFSFHPVKSITTGEGGAVVTNDASLYERLLLFRNHGITRSAQKFINKNAGPWYYEMQLLGYNFRLTDIQCALGISQLKKLEQFIKRRKEIVSIYNDAFRNNPAFTIPAHSDYVEPAWHLYILRVKSCLDRNKLINLLFEQGVGTQVHYIPVYRHPYYTRISPDPEAFPNAEAYYRECLSIPLFPGLKEAEIDKVINAVTACSKILMDQGNC